MKSMSKVAQAEMSLTVISIELIPIREKEDEKKERRQIKKENKRKQ